MLVSLCPSQTAYVELKDVAFSHLHAYSLWFPSVWISDSWKNASLPCLSYSLLTVWMGFFDYMSQVSQCRFLVVCKIIITSYIGQDCDQYWHCNNGLWVFVANEPSLYSAKHLSSIVFCICFFKYFFLWLADLSSLYCYSIFLGNKVAMAYSASSLSGFTLLNFDDSV